MRVNKSSIMIHLSHELPKRGSLIATREARRKGKAAAAAAAAAALVIKAAANAAPVASTTQLTTIKQAYLASSVSFFGNRFIKKYNLSPYINRKEPAVFFGCYRDRDLQVIMRHRALCVLVWRGTDAMRLTPRTAAFLRAGNIKHVAISSYIEKDLKKYNLPYKSIPITAADPNLFKPCQLGDKLYVYIIDRMNAQRRALYGMHILETLMPILAKHKIDVLVGSSSGSQSTPYTAMPELYSKCFMGLRLTSHDGLSNTVLEMGLMGRYCIWNGNTPNAISWDTTNSIIESIMSERAKIGSVHEELAGAVARYIDIGDNWLKSSYWES